MDNNLYCVYLHKNKTNGKIYIGQTIHNDNPELRWGKNGIGYSNNNHFWSSIQKYGWDNFEHIILAKDLSKEEADELEIYYIQKFKTQNNKFGYNIASGGHNGSFPHTSESKKKISDSLKGKTLSKETKQKISESLNEYYLKNEAWNKGILHSDQTKKKISDSLKGRQFSEEHRKKLSEANHRRDMHFSEERNRKISQSKIGNRYMNNSKKCIVVKPEDIDYYKELGYVFGRLKTK